jgi:hypothetical protein
MTDEERFVELSWALIEFKFCYYKPEGVHVTRKARYEIPDDVYDQLEQEYLRLCLKLDRPNTVAHKSYADIGEVPGEGMFEIDMNRPSVQRVARKLGSALQ